VNKLEAFIAIRNKAFIELDLEFARRMVGQRDDLTLLMALHKARYDCTQIPDKYRHESAQWLRKRGLGAMFRPLLPEGELPR